MSRNNYGNGKNSYGKVTNTQAQRKNKSFIKLKKQRILKIDKIQKVQNIEINDTENSTEN